jgi:hypothetical protein
MASTAYKIEKGVPVVRYGRVRGFKYPFRDMDVGDSFLVPFGEDESLTRSRLSSAIAGFNVRNAPKRFTSSKQSDGFRVWRIA